MNEVAFPCFMPFVIASLKILKIQVLIFLENFSTCSSKSKLNLYVFVFLKLIKICSISSLRLVILLVVVDTVLVL